MCDSNIKSLASCMLSVAEAIQRGEKIPPEKYNTITATCNKIFVLPTDKESLKEKAEAKPTYSFKSFVKACEESSDYVRGAFVSFGELAHCLYFVSPDKKYFCQPIYKKDYKPECAWLPTNEDLSKNIIGFMPVFPCDYSTVKIKPQWLKKIADYAGTKNGVETHYQQIFQDLQQTVYPNPYSDEFIAKLEEEVAKAEAKPEAQPEAQPEAKPEAQPEAKPEAQPEEAAKA